MLNTVQINKKNHKTKKEYSMFWQNLYYEMRSIAYDALELADEYSGGDSETLRELVKRLDAVDNYRNELEM